MSILWDASCGCAHRHLVSLVGGIALRHGSGRVLLRGEVALGGLARRAANVLIDMQCRLRLLNHLACS